MTPARRIEDVDRVVGGVRHVDVAARGMDGGMVEAALPLVLGQLDMADEQWRSGHGDTSRLAAHAEPERDGDDAAGDGKAERGDDREPDDAAVEDVDDDPAAERQHDGAAQPRRPTATKVWPIAWNADISVFMPMKA